MNKINWAAFRQKLREDIVVLPHFFRNPVLGMRTLPHWDWPTILVLQGAFAAACGIIGNFLERDFLGVAISVVVAPLTHFFMGAIASGFFYYVFKFFFNREIPYRQIYIHVLFASIPLVIVAIVAFLMPPIVLLGMTASVLLLFVGFVDNFQLPKRPCRNLLLGILGVCILYWGFQQVSHSSKHKTLRQKATPESLDILEKELNE